MFFAEKFSQSQCSICPVGSHCHNTRSRRCEGSTRICNFQRQFKIRNFQRQVQICNFQRWVQICNFQRWFKIRNFQKWPFKDKQGEHTYFFSAASSLPLSFLDTFSLFFLELMALAVVALVPALFFGTTADTLEVPVAAVGTGTGASLLMLPLLLSPWWCSCTVARPLHLCCQKSWILVWRQLLWLFGSLCVKDLMIAVILIVILKARQTDSFLVGARATILALALSIGMGPSTEHVLTAILIPSVSLLSLPPRPWPCELLVIIYIPDWFPSGVVSPSLCYGIKDVIPHGSRTRVFLEHLMLGFSADFVSKVHHISHQGLDG